MESRAFSTKSVDYLIKRDPRLPKIYAPQEAFDFHKSTLSGMVDAISDGAWNAKASNFVAKHFRDVLASFAVYVVTAPDLGLDICKIGISNNPISRLSGIQCGNWNRLAVHSLLWIVTEAGSTMPTATDVEQTALRAAKEMGCRLSGEWVSMSPTETAELTVKAAKHLGVDVCSSEMFVSNIGSRVSTLGEINPRVRLTA